MVTVIRSDDLPAVDRRERWQDAVCNALGPLDLRVAADTPLRGQIVTGQLGAVTFTKVQTATPQSVHRTPRLIRLGSPEYYRVVVPITGRPRLAQDDRIVTLDPGQFTIYDFTRPYDLDYTGTVDLSVLTIPRALMPLQPEAVARLTAQPLPGGRGAGTLVTALAPQIAEDLSQYDPVTGARLSTIVLDLLTTALTESLGHGGSRAPTAPESLRFQVHAFIEEHLQDRGLTIASIAAANHISVRTLHRLFAAEETTVAGWIRRRRLERCRKDLVDPTLRHLAVSTIAARWGMPESAHFSRLFRREYGVPPTEYRTFCLSSGTGGQAHGTHDHDAASARGGS